MKIFVLVIFRLYVQFYLLRWAISTEFLLLLLIHFMHILIQGLKLGHYWFPQRDLQSIILTDATHFELQTVSWNKTQVSPKDNAGSIHTYIYIYIYMLSLGRPQWPSGLRHEPFRLPKH
jgi:hypothetical protein